MGECALDCSISLSEARNLISVAMAQMQMVVASIYAKYTTRISPKTSDESMEVVDQITSAGPAVILRFI